MAKLDPVIAQLLHLVDEAFDHAAWHGPTLRGALRGSPRNRRRGVPRADGTRSAS